MRGKEAIVAFLLGIAINIATDALTSQASISVAMLTDTQRGGIVLILVVLFLAIVLVVSAYLQARRFTKRLHELFTSFYQTLSKHLELKQDRTFITSLSFARYQTVLALQQFYNKRHNEDEIGC